MISASLIKTGKRPGMISANLIKTAPPGMIGASPIKTGKRPRMISASLIKTGPESRQMIGFRPTDRERVADKIRTYRPQRIGM